jgi:hypothetical protein
VIVKPVIFEHLPPKRKEGAEMFWEKPTSEGCDTSGASFAALYLWLKIIYPQS